VFVKNRWHDREQHTYIDKIIIQIYSFHILSN
jgi:hypothetical protein